MKYTVAIDILKDQFGRVYIEKTGLINFLQKEIIYLHENKIEMNVKDYMPDLIKRIEGARSNDEIKSEGFLSEGEMKI